MLANKELLFSKGAHGEVYKIDPKATLSNNPDLMKLVISTEPQKPKQEFFRALAAYSLLPSYFPAVTGFSDIGLIREVDTYGQDQYAGEIYMKALKVPPEHAIAAMHSHVARNGQKRWCDCYNCTQHHQFHADYYLQDSAKIFAGWVRQFGFEINHNDFTDHCLDLSANSVVWFEADKINLKRLRKTILDSNHLTTATKNSLIDLSQKCY